MCKTLINPPQLNTPWSAPLALLLLRLSLGAKFLISGLPIMGSNIAFVANLGTFEVVGGALLILGLFTRLCSAGFVVISAIGIVVARGFSISRGVEMELTLLASLLLLFLQGGGAWSMEAYLLKRLKK